MSDYIEFHCLLTPEDRVSAYKSRGTTFVQVQIDSGGSTLEVLLGSKEMRGLGQWFIQKADELETRFSHIPQDEWTEYDTEEELRSE